MSQESYVAQANIKVLLPQRKQQQSKASGEQRLHVSPSPTPGDSAAVIPPYEPYRSLAAAGVVMVGVPYDFEVRSLELPSDP